MVISISVTEKFIIKIYNYKNSNINKLILIILYLAYILASAQLTVLEIKPIYDITFINFILLEFVVPIVHFWASSVIYKFGNMEN